MSTNLPPFLAVEFMYRRPPVDRRARAVFMTALRTRMDALSADDGVAFLCETGLQSLIEHDLRVLLADYPHITRTFSSHTLGIGSAPQSAPFDWGGVWQRMNMTDRWLRIKTSLSLADYRSNLEDGYLLMPAHDAIYSRDLLLQLVDFSRQHAQNGLPAAVSPYTYHQHSPLPSASIPMPIVDLVNAAFHRDPGFRLQLERGEVQGFWGKMGLIPFDMCGDLLKTVDTGVWEDDLELDRAINALGYASRALWIDDPAAYRHILPAFSAADVRRIIERHLHYSLRNGGGTGGSHLTAPLTDMARYLRVIDPRFDAASAWADQIIEQEYAKMMRRVDQHGASWVDWGAYRYLARPYDPHVEVWKRSNE